MPQLIGVLLVLAAANLLHGVTAAQGGSSTSEIRQQHLSLEDLQTALASGATIEHEAYPLHSGGDVDGRTGTISGVVYTPFLRVAMWAGEWRQLHDAVPDVSQVPERLLEPAIVIAVHEQPCCSGLKSEPPLRVCAVLAPMGPTAILPCEDPLDAKPALWVTADPSYLAEFDPENLARTVLVAAFRIGEVRSGWRFVTERRRRRILDGKAVSLVGFSPITAADTQRWR